MRTRIETDMDDCGVLPSKTLEIGQSTGITGRL